MAEQDFKSAPLQDMLAEARRRQAEQQAKEVADADGDVRMQSSSPSKNKSGASSPSKGARAYIALLSPEARARLDQLRAAARQVALIL